VTESFADAGGEEEAEPGPEGPEEEQEKEIQAGAASSSFGEGAEKRRRRRRRGRRGRRREGELVPAGGEAPAYQPAEQPAVATPFVQVPEAPVVMPNAPSSPLWSLMDRAPEEAAPLAALPESAVQLHAEASIQTREEPDMAVLSAETEAPKPEPATAPEAEALPAPEEGPREVRKGWWQRRFKM
jgi:ribonuclease E